MASVITITGEQLFAAKAQANEQLDIDTFIFANVPNQNPNAPINREEGIPTAHIVYQQNVQQVGRINDNVVVYSTVLDSITGPFEFNWVGLYSSVNQKLVAINHVPTVTKTATAPGAAGNTLNRNFGIEYSGIAELTGITVEPETWQLDFTARLSGMDKLTQQLAADMNGKDWFIDDGLKVVPRATANSFSVTPGVGYVSGLRVELKQEHILIVQSYPQFVYVDAWFSGNANSTWSPQLAFTVTNTEMDDYIDPSGTQHYVYKLAVINAADDVEDLRKTEGIYSKRIEAPYVIAVNKSELQQAIDKAANAKKPYPQINNSSNSGCLIVDLGGNAVIIDRPIELPAGYGGYSIKNGLIAPNINQFPVGENLIEYVGVGDHPFIGFENLQLECSRIANGMYVNRSIENRAEGLRIHGQKDWGIRIGSDSGHEFNMSSGCVISEFFNNEDGFLNPTSIGLLIDVGNAADNNFYGLIVKYCKKQFDIGTQANKFIGCHFYGNGSKQYEAEGRSIIKGNAKRNQFNASYFDTCGLEIINPSQTQILSGRFASGSAVHLKSYIHLNAITANHNMDALMIKDNMISLIGNYEASLFSWEGTLGRIRDSDVSNNMPDLQGNLGDTTAIKIHSTKAYKRSSGIGVNQVTASFNDVLLWNSSIQRLIDSEVELTNIQPHNTTFSNNNVTVSLPSGQFSNITLRTSVDISSRFSRVSDQYPL